MRLLRRFAPRNDREKVPRNDRKRVVRNAARILSLEERSDEAISKSMSKSSKTLMKLAYRKGGLVDGTGLGTQVAG